jgi:DNA primase large subunit
VLQDMLQLLKESVSSKHAERLEQIVIALIAIEIGELCASAFPPCRKGLMSLLVLGIVTILVDLMS